MGNSLIFDEEGDFKSVEMATFHAIHVQGGFTTNEIEAKRMLSDGPKYKAMGEKWLDENRPNWREKITCNYLKDYVDSKRADHLKRMDLFWNLALSCRPNSARRFDWRELVYHNGYQQVRSELNLNLKGLGPNRLHALSFNSAHCTFPINGKLFNATALFGQNPNGQWRDIAGLAILPYLMINFPDELTKRIINKERPIPQRVENRASQGIPANVIRDLRSYFYKNMASANI
jgi:hypothetical protein